MVAGEQIHAVVLAGHLAKAPDAVAGFLMGPTILIPFRWRRFARFYWWHPLGKWHPPITFQRARR